MRALITGKDQGLARALANQLEARPEKYEVDILSPESIEMFSWKDEGVGGPYDVIINNWGINHLSHIGQTEAGDFKILEDNIWKPYIFINNLVRDSHPPAKVINVASQTYRIAQRTTALYCASKAALVQMTKVMARELGPKGWQINAYAPGKILDTEMTRKTDNQVKTLRGWDDDESDQYARNLIPVGRYMTLNEAAHNCLTILDFTDYVNGTVIEAMGGI